MAEDGTIYAMGSNMYGGLGTGDEERFKEIISLSLPAELVTLASGEHHTLALLRNGLLYGWGSNLQGQLGIGEGKSATAPTVILIPYSEEIVHISAGAHFSLALTRQGTVYGWGENGNKQITSEGSTIFLPTLIPLPSPIVDLTCGWSHSLFITHDGTVYGLGSNDHGVILPRSNSSIPTFYTEPILLPLPEPVTQIVAGAYFSIFFLKSGTILGCGDNESGCLDQGDTKKQKEYVEMFRGRRIKEVAAGGHHFVALTVSRMEDGGR
jgi:alpha-tubulin suppressor-like RCC1 family protein